VSGDVAATGSVHKASVDTVSGSVLVDSTGSMHAVNVNTVSGGVTLRLDDDLAANYVARTVSGRVLVDGAMRSSSGPTTFASSTGQPSGMFVDVRANTVSGDITVLRRGASGVRAGDLDAEAEW
ncbi:DUF4097 domain-containing protein, partial [Acinetobacter baumannii]|nr:DUF4097 domain-containing protein [Acinetobacter baumannii]